MTTVNKESSTQAGLLTLIKSASLVENIVLFFSLVSANMFCYFSYFDLNSFVFVDGTAVTRHILTITGLFVVISAAVHVAITFLQNFIAGKGLKALPSIVDMQFDIYSSKPFIVHIHDLLGNKILKFGLTILLFSLLYVGPRNSLFIIAFFILYLLIVLAYRMRFEDATQDSGEINDSTESSKKVQFAKYKKIHLIKTLLMLHSVSGIVFEPFDTKNRERSYRFIASKVGVLLMLLSLCLGVARAEFVSREVVVKLNADTALYSLFMASSNGVTLFNVSSKEIVFVSWDSSDKIIFQPENQRSIRFIWSKIQ